MLVREMVNLSNDLAVTTDGKSGVDLRLLTTSSKLFYRQSLGSDV